MHIPANYEAVEASEDLDVIVGQWVNADASAVLTAVHVEHPSEDLPVGYEIGRVRRAYPKKLDAKRTMTVDVPGASTAELMQLRSGGSQVSVLAAQAPDGSVHVFKAACPIASTEGQAEAFEAFFGSVAFG